MLALVYETPALVVQTLTSYRICQRFQVVIEGKVVASGSAPGTQFIRDIHRGDERLSPFGHCGRYTEVASC